MAKNNFFYLMILVLLFFGFFTVLDQHKVRAGEVAQQLSGDLLRREWTVAEVKEIYSARDLSSIYKAVEYQFLSSGGFVEMEKKQVNNTGTWHLENNLLEIRYDRGNRAITYQTELVSTRELLLINDSVQFRLLRL